VGYFLLFIQVPSVEEEPSDFIDKLKRGSSQPQDFNYIHSSLQIDYSSLEASRVLGA
jgi:hypothetical protein